MKANLYELGQDLKHPYQRALLLIAAIPLFPEYVSFFLVIASAIFALQDLRQNPRTIRIGFIGKVALAGKQAGNGQERVSQPTAVGRRRHEAFAAHSILGVGQQLRTWRS